MQRTVESLRFDDLLGTVPVEVTLVHNGYSVLDTGVLGSVFWARTGPLGLGADLRVTGPPNAGGTLASYVDPDFLKVNAQSVSDAAAKTVSSCFSDPSLELPHPASASRAVTATTAEILVFVIMGAPLRRWLT